MDGTEHLAAVLRIGAEKNKQLGLSPVVEVEVRVDSGAVAACARRCSAGRLAPLAAAWMVSEAPVCCGVAGCQ